MPRVDLPNGLAGSENLDRTTRNLTNCFNNHQGQIIPRPGITQLTTTSSRVARGQFVWNGSLYQVVSTDLIKITNTTTGAHTTIGTIAGSAVVDVAIGFNTATIIVNASDGALYTLDKTDTLVDISSNSNIVPCTALTHIDGRFVYIPFDGDPAFFSDVGEAGTVQATSFFDAESLPDKNSTVFEIKGTLYIGGTDSIELFRNTGLSPNPFQRITGARITNGFIGGLQEYKLPDGTETFLFIGREKDQDSGIYAVGAGRAPKISNQRIDLILGDHTVAELQAAISGRFKWRGFDIATFVLANSSFAYFDGDWFLLETIDDIGAAGTWGGGFVNQFEGTYFTAFEDKIGKLVKGNTDYGVDQIKTIDAGFTSDLNDWFSGQSVEVDVSQGHLTADDETVGLFLSRDNVNYSNGFFRALGDLGQYAKHLEWNFPGGLGAYNGFMGLRLQTSADISFSVDSLVVNIR